MSMERLSKVPAFFRALLCAVLALLIFAGAFSPQSLAADTAHSDSRQIPSPFMTGYSGGIMAPDKTISRAEFLKMLMVALLDYNETLNYGAPSFSDIAVRKWYTGYIAYAEQLGIAEGYSDGTFHPDEPISRAQAAKLLALSLPDFSIETEEKSLFQDVSGWAVPYVNALAEKGIVSGYQDGTFLPNRKISRGEAAKMVCASLGFSPSKEEISLLTSSLGNPFSDVSENRWYYIYLLYAAGYLS